MSILEKIKHIKNYKSYSDYKWDNLSKHLSKSRNETEAYFCKGFNIIFGENGSGKSAIVQVLKSLSQNNEFIDSSPEKVTLQFKDTEFTFENNQWVDDKRLDKTDIIFFDTEFISTNIHTNGCRETAINKGAHTQHSGKLLIECDSEAIKLKNDYDTAETSFDKYKKDNKTDLDFELSENEQFFFDALKDKGKSEIRNIQNKLPKDITNLESEISQLETNKSKISDIQSIEEVDTFDELKDLPEETIITELYTRDVKEKSVKQVSEEVLNKLSTYESFYKDHKDLCKSDNCPFCGNTLNTDQAKKLLLIYQSHFDITYENNLQQFKNDITKQVAVFESIKSSISSIAKSILEKQKLFNAIVKKHNLKGISSSPEFDELSYDSLDKIINDLNKLLDRKKSNFSSENFQKILKSCEAGENAIELLNTWINENNVLIEDFKEKNKSEETINEQITAKGKNLQMLKLTQEFINDDKVSKNKNALKVKKQANDLEELLKTSKEAYEEYLEKLPADTAKKMQELVNDHFYLDFKLIGEKTKIGKEDLKSIKKIYDFCNWGNHLHSDKEEPASLNELQTYIDKFLEVRNRYITN